MQASVIGREFTWSGVKIPDPGRHLSPEEVRAVLATMYPDIATATITGAEAVGKNYSIVSSPQSAPKDRG
jgi:PRTRC genetic system protein C